MRHLAIVNFSALTLAPDPDSILRYCEQGAVLLYMTFLKVGTLCHVRQSDQSTRNNEDAVGVDVEVG